MSSGYQLGNDAAFTVIETADIGGTSANSGYLDMSGFERALAYVEIGTWDSGDDLDECRFQQASDASGTGVKDLTTDASGGNYDTDNPVDADGDWVVLEIKASDMDVANGFNHIRLYLGEGGNTGVDNVTAFVIRYGARDKYAQRNGAAVTGSNVYVTPQS